MSDIDTVKAELKKISARAIQAKMDLHDLSEDLPANWQSIPAVASTAFNAFTALEQKRAELKRLETPEPCRKA